MGNIHGQCTDMAYTVLIDTVFQLNPENIIIKDSNCKLLEENMQSLIEAHPIVNGNNKAYFLQDNFPIHCSKYTIDFYNKKEVQSC